jgi:predicted chitinase
MNHLKNYQEYQLNEQVNPRGAVAYISKMLGWGEKEAESSVSPVSGNVNIGSAIVSTDVKKNIEAVMEAMKRHGITNPFTQRAILGTIGKECGFVPQNEIGYGNTSNERIRKIFGRRITVTDADLNLIKKDDVKFFDLVYGSAATKVFGFNTGNTQPGDGYKYRGRGFNGITFKSGYERMQKVLQTQGKLNRPIDIVQNPDQLNEIDIAAEAAVLFFINAANNETMQRKYGLKDINQFKDQQTALKGIVNINAGLGNNIEGNYLASLEKATQWADKFKLDSSNLA